MPLTVSSTTTSAQCAAFPSALPDHTRQASAQSREKQSRENRLCPGREPRGDTDRLGVVFGRKKKTDETAPPAEGSAAQSAQQTPAPSRGPAPKGRPTPKQRDQVAARKRPLVPDDRRAAREAQREHIREVRQKQRIALETGDDRYLPPRDRGPQRRFARDWVDARTGLGEWMLVLVLVFLFTSLLLPEDARLVMSQALWVLVLLVIVEGWYVGRSVRKRAEAKFGEMERGLRFYSAMRSLQIRRLRLPKPLVARGEYPV